jgi:hypothetical protein
MVDTDSHESASVRECRPYVLFPEGDYGLHSLLRLMVYAPLFLFVFRYCYRAFPVRPPAETLNVYWISLAGGLALARPSIRGWKWWVFSIAAPFVLIVPLTGLGILPAPNRSVGGFARWAGMDPGFFLYALKAYGESILPLVALGTFCAVIVFLPGQRLTTPLAAPPNRRATVLRLTVFGPLFICAASPILFFELVILMMTLHHLRFPRMI